MKDKEKGTLRGNSGAWGQRRGASSGWRRLLWGLLAVTPLLFLGVKLALPGRLRSGPDSQGADAQPSEKPGGVLPARETWRLWTEGVGANPNDGEAWRSLLRKAAQAPPLPRRVTAEVLEKVPTFLHGVGTNAADLELVVRACAAQDANDLICSLLDPLKEARPASLGLVHAEALLRTGRHTDFADMTRSLSEETVRATGLRPYQLAWQAGWGAPAERRSALDELVTLTRAAPRDRDLAKVLVLAAGQAGEPALCREGLRRLTSAHLDTPFDHAQLWHALRRNGERRTAWELARYFYRPPSGPAGVLALAREFAALGLDDHCLDCLERGLRRFRGHNSHTAVLLQVWAADYCMRRRRWLAVEAQAATLRKPSGEAGRFLGYGAFLEGCAAWGKVYPKRAAACFQAAVAAGFSYAEMAGQAGITLMQLGHPDLALQALTPFEAQLDSIPGAWEAVWNASLALHRDAGQLLRAARKLHEAAPQDPVAKFNLAAALLIADCRPAKALTLTWDVHTALPHSLAVTLNHALALVRNDRAREAAELLAPLNPDRLTPSEQSTYYLAQAEIHLAQDRQGQARKDLEHLSREGLFPSQQRHLDRLGQQASAAPVATTQSPNLPADHPSGSVP